MRLESFLFIGLALWLTAVGSCSGKPPDNFTAERLRSRTTLAWSLFVDGNFEAYVAMWSARAQPTFKESEEDWQRTVRNWRLFLSRETPTSELLEVRITGIRARAKMRVSTLETDGSRGYGMLYDYWVFENGDWFLDDAGRTE